VGIMKARNRNMKQIIYEQKRLREVEKQMKLGAKELARMSTPAPMTPAERREMRAEQQRQRRANKALLSVVL
jgi:hypothetical protein